MPRARSGTAAPTASGATFDTASGIGGELGLQVTLAARVAVVEEQQELIHRVLDELEQLAAASSTTAIAAEPHGVTAIERGDGAPGDDLGGEPGDSGTEPPGPQLNMVELLDWVETNIANVIQRKVPQTGGYPYWCRRWWAHTEAIVRFEALRRSWLEAVDQPTGTALVVYLEHLDSMLDRLCGEAGPFSGCTGGEHRDSSGATLLGQERPDADCGPGPTPGSLAALMKTP